ncbi:MAG: TonB-dependent receptor [Aureispira sp.]|nr:TonB-dependent receptor [Aureispira sp.]
MRTLKYISAFILAFGLQSSIQAQYSLQGQLRCSSSQQAISEVTIFLENTNDLITSDKKGSFQFKALPSGDYTLTFYKEGYASLTQVVKIVDQNININIPLDSLNVNLSTVNVSIQENGYGMRHMRAVEGMAIYASKKTEVIELKNTLANLSNNNSRQLYAKVAGLNIWENDNSGIQLNIGGRGLNPNRTSNFNTRQNGYDISADALGYPETYYIPPSQALKRIEIIRGAASLQYGTQFGGLLNFVLKNGPDDKKFEFTSENTYGAYNFFNTFNSIGGTLADGKFKYYGFYQYKRGDGWRPNADYQTHNGYLALQYKPTKKLTLNLEQTIMNYVAHQPGGLTDQEFKTDARQSKRERNWFRVDWKLSALNVTYKFSEKTRINFRNFLLYAGRQSLGNLQPINRPDYGGSRDLIKGCYFNFGNETRLLHRYSILKQPTVLLVGVRAYKGATQQQQGYSNDGKTGTLSDFQFENPADGILKSDYKFPSFNFAAFAENYFTIGPKFSITPGIRYEYIHTKANGYYQDLFVVPAASGFDTLKNEAIPEQRQSQRSIFLMGLGASYKPLTDLELYANFSQNYRAINFNDMRIVNPNQEIDPNLKDEFGFNADLGFRGTYKHIFNFDVSLFYLSYKRRIGNIQSSRPNAENPLIIEPYTLRTNIGDARVFGVESLIEADIWRLITKNKKTDWGIVLFTNFSWLDGRYLQTANSYASGKQLEFVPPVTLRTGLSVSYKKLKLAYQYSYTAKHYSDATNAELVPNAVVGVIPSYHIMDLSASYEWRWLKAQAGINNLTNAKYFTRRAPSYPGPGILPADGLSFYVTLAVQLGVK